MKAIGLFLCSIIMVLVAGCWSVETCSDMVYQSPTNVVPTAGTWTTSITINPSSLTQIGFLVITSSTGDVTVRITVDGYKYYETPVSNGTFAYSNGNYASGMDCPSDGFVISGRFISTTAATGHFASLRYCSCLKEGDFAAQLQP